MTRLKFVYRFAILCLLVNLLSGDLAAQVKADPTPLIFDTDMDTDCDDMAAMAVLHALADNGEIKILGTLVSSKYAWSAPCVEAVNRYYGRPDLPIGVPKGNGASVKRGSAYARQIAERFPGNLKTNDDAEDAVKIYRRLLAEAKNGSVVIVTVGYLTNLSDLLSSKPDELSPLDGKELVRKKVARYVCMGGRYPQQLSHGEWGNFMPDPKAVLHVIRDWPLPIIFSGDGEKVLTGYSLPETPENNPVRVAYKLYLGNKESRPSWDPITLLYAIRPEADYWKVTDRGYNHVFDNGTNQWKAEPDKDHILVQIPDSKTDEVTKILERLITQPPTLKPHQGKAWDFSHGPLAVSPDRRFLVHEDGTRFLWIGDTAWEMFHRLTRDEAEFYLEKRRSQGFTVIQAVALAECAGLTRPTPAGFLPLIDKDPTRPDVKDGPDNDYWDDVDFMVDLAARKGLYIAMLPTWGDKVLKKWGQGPEIFTPENAEKYGFFIGKRYGNRPNLIWVLGGDRPCERESDYAVWRAMAKGIKAGEKATEQGFEHLMTFHPMGGNTSSKWFHKDDWLDFNMFQSGHGAKDGANYKMVAHDRNLVPTKPVLDGEPRYENHPVRGDKTKTQWFDDFDVRQAAYWSIFSGAFGHTYGCHDIWMMYDGTKERQCADARTPWKESVDLPGAWQMLHLRRLLIDGKLLEKGWKPCQEVIIGENPDGTGHVVACQTNDLNAVFVYLPTGRSIDLDFEKASFDPKAARFYWFNLRTREKEKFEYPEGAPFDPPGDEQRGNDWILIIER